MTFDKVNLNNPNYLQTIQAYQSGAVSLSKSELQRLLKTLEEALTFAQVNKAVNCALLSILKDENTTFEFLRRSPQFRYSSFLRTKCELEKICRLVIKNLEMINYANQENLLYLHSIVLLAPLRKEMQQLRFQILNHFREFQKKNPGRSLVKSLMAFTDYLFASEHFPSAYGETSKIKGRSKEEIASADSFGQKVMGKAVGAEIERSNNYGNQLMPKVVAVFDKFQYAFINSLELAETRFAEESGMIFFKGKETTSLKKFMFEHSLKLGKELKDIYELYNTHIATVGMLAQYRNNNQFNIWLEMTVARVAPLFAYGADERTYINQALRAPLVVVDSTFLFGFFILLAKPELLKMTSIKWVVAKTTIEELRQTKDRIKQKEASTFIGVEDGVLKKTMLSREQLDKQAELIDSIIAWCKENTLIKRPVKEIGTGHDLDELSEVIGASANDTLLLASQQGAGVASDDERLKSYGLGQFGLPSFSSYQVLLMLWEQSLITREDFEYCYRDMIRANYVFIPVNADDLWFFLEESGFSCGIHFVSAVQGLKIMEAKPAAHVVVEFSRQLYLNLSIAELRVTILSVLISEIKANNKSGQIKLLINSITRTAFSLLPKQREEFCAIVNALL